jgi:2-oxoglutarate/2-oxoacid ferredoxin oxidoreductase subunit alpha
VSDTSTVDETTREAESVSAVSLRFAGDSGDGMQLAGARFTEASAIFGNDLSTFPNFPAEIRAPAGTLPGVSSFQIQIADRDILTPGDQPDVLVVMNPAALKANLGDLAPAGTIIVNSDAFDERNLNKAGYEANPLEDGTLDAYRVLEVPMEELTKKAVEESGIKGRGMLRSKNFFAVGLLAWMFDRPLEPTLDWINSKFARDQQTRDANTLAFRAGYHLGETTEMFRHTYEVQPAALPPGTYTNVTGNQGLAWGLVAASQAARIPLFYASYPITPASEILHELARLRYFGVRTFQAEDEIAAVGAALGAAFGGHLGVTGTSGPGLALKGETISLAVAMELPMLIVDVQRGGPSTGLPTKPEQADLLMALYGRHGEAPLPVVAASRPSDAFDAAIEATRIALKYMTPVILLSDGYIATSAEPWLLPDVETLPDIEAKFARRADGGDGPFLPYLRDEATLARPWAIPGTEGLEHRLGGLEKEDGTGNVSYDPLNHEKMTLLRERKITGIADDIPEVEVGGDEDASVAVLAWGSSYGPVLSGIRRVQARGHRVAHIHLIYLHPFPRNLEEVLRRYETILIPEMNRGHLWRMIRAEYLIDPIRFSKVQGQPFKATEIEAKLMELIEA